MDVPGACLRIVDVRGIMGRACARQWGAHVQSNGLRMCKAMGRACAKQWLAHVQSNCVRMAMARVNVVNCPTRQSLLLFIRSLHRLSRIPYPDNKEI